jgi:hypothetical protein
MNAGADLSSEQMTTNPSPSVGGSSYNVTRVKYQVKQHAANIEEEKARQQSQATGQAAQSSSQSEVANTGGQQAVQ